MGTGRLQELGDRGPRRARAAGGKIDQLAVEAVTLRAPEVFLDVRTRMDREGPPLVELCAELGDQRDDQGRQRQALAELGLPVADANLDRAKRVMRPDAPPDLR